MKRPGTLDNQKPLLSSIIDIGSNAMRLKVFRSLGVAPFQVIFEERIPLRLGQEAFQGDHIISSELISKTSQTIAHFDRIADFYKVDRKRAVATAALREAHNKEEVVEQIFQRTGVLLEVIPALEEARLIQLGTMLDTDEQTGLCCFIDIGGGSVELSIGSHEDGALEFASLNLGAVRLTEKFIDSDPISRSDYKALKSFIREEIDHKLERFKTYKGKVQASFGTGGATNECIKLCRNRNKNLEAAQRSKASFQEIQELFKALRVSSFEDRKSFPGLNSSRADIIVASSIVLREVMKALELPMIFASKRGLAEGAVIDLLQRECRESGEKTQRRTREIRHCRQAVLAFLIQSFKVPTSQAKKIRNFCLELFDQLEAYHGFPKKVRELFETAAMLSKLGRLISHKAYHKHSSYIIENLDIPGFSTEECLLVSQIVRYHRKPSSKNLARVDLSTFKVQGVHALEILEWGCAILGIAIELEKYLHAHQGENLLQLQFEDECQIFLATPAEKFSELSSSNENFQSLDFKYHNALHLLSTLLATQINVFVPCRQSLQVPPP